MITTIHDWMYSRVRSIFLPQRDVENITKGIINGKHKNISIRNAVVIAI